VGLAYAAICPHRAENQTPAQTQVGLVQCTGSFILMSHPILDYLKKHGELPATKIFIPDMTLGSIKNALRNYYFEGVLLRREIVMEGWETRMCMAYSLSGEAPRIKLRKQPNYKKLQAFALKNEPDYAYYLRNLPRGGHETHNDIGQMG
jgi:hypothetical protein